MMHPHDFEILSILLRVDSMPDDIESEYAIRQRMYHGCGGTGPLRALALIEMLRFLGHEQPERPASTNVDWRQHIGARVVAQHGDVEVEGSLVAMAPDGGLVLLLDGVEGETELPRYLVRLCPDGAKGPGGAKAKAKRAKSVSS